MVFKNDIFCVSGVHLYLSEIVLFLFSVVIHPWCIFVCLMLFCVFNCVSSVHLCVSGCLVSFYSLVCF